MDKTVEPLLNHLVPFLLVLFRVSGLFVFTPVLASSAIPLNIRTLVALVLSLAAYPTLAPVVGTTQAPDLLSLAPLVLGEVLIGAVIGLIAAMPIYAAQLGGQVMGYQVGLGLGSVFNPALDTEADVLGQLLLYVAMAIFVGIGGLESTFVAVASTFQHIPIGGGLGAAGPLELICSLAGTGFEVALRVSAPVLGIIFLEMLASGIIMRTMPQLNILTIGFPLKIIAALGVLAAGIGGIAAVLEADVAGTLTDMLIWSRGGEGGT